MIRSTSPSRHWIAARTLVLAVIGGFAINSLGIPLGWLLGSMLASMTATVAKVETSAPAWVRVPTLAILGAMLGSTFSPSTIGVAGGWMSSMAVMVGAEIAMSALVVWYFQRVSGYDPATAYFSGICGVIAQSTACAFTAGADVPKVAISHGFRIVLLLLIVPPLAMKLAGISAPAVAAATSGSAVTLEPGLLLALAALCTAGVLLGKITRIPSPHMLGPMALFAVLHLSGVYDGAPPRWLTDAALVGLGVVIGSRFAGVTGGSLIGMVRTTLPGFVVLCLGLAAATGLMTWITGFPVALSLLILTPSGVAEMALVALSCGIDPATVAIHHAIRIALTLPAVPILFECRRYFASRTPSA